MLHAQTEGTKSQISALQLDTGLTNAKMDPVTRYPVMPLTSLYTIMFRIVSTPVTAPTSRCRGRGSELYLCAQ